MTDPTSGTTDPQVPTPTSDPVAAPDATTSTGTPPAESTVEVENPSREAASYRLRLRDAEADRDVIRGRLEVYERQHVERVAGERMAVPADLWMLAPDLDQLRGEDGAIDDDLVRGAVETVLADRPTWDKARQPRLPAPMSWQGRGLQHKPTGQEAFTAMVNTLT